MPVPTGSVRLTLFPLWGAAAEVAGGWLLDTVDSQLSRSLAALLTLAVVTALTGAPFERALLRSGGAALVAAVGLGVIRWYGIASLAAPVIPALAAVLALGRASAAALVWSTPPAASEDAVALSNATRSGAALLAICSAIPFAVWPGGAAASLLLGSSTLLTIVFRRYLMWRRGGFTLGALGAAGIAIETACLLMFICEFCRP